MSAPTESQRLPWLEASSRSEQFFLLAQERYQIQIRRLLGGRPPLTLDPVLQRYRFCNVHREHDKTTQWFRENVRSKLDLSGLTDEEVVLSVTAFRWFNRIETGERLLKMLSTGKWDSEHVREALSNQSPLVTGAYMVKTPARMSKLEGIIWCMEWFVGASVAYQVAQCGTLEHAWSTLTLAPYLGDFMAYEVVSDLRWVRHWKSAPDINTWANPGPGAARGLGWIYHDDPGRYDRHRERDRAEMLDKMRELLELSRQEHMWPSHWTPWEMREVEHWLCEYDKWCRGHYLGQALKRRYEPT